MKPGIRDLIPTLIVFLFVACLVALLMELLVPVMAGRSADSTVITALSGILAACVPALGLLYLKDTGTKPPPSDEEEQPPAIDELTMRKAKETLDRYLDQMRAWSRWRLRLP